MKRQLSLQRNTSNKTIEQGFKDFYRYCMVKNLSDRTLDYYQMCIDSFAEYMPLDNRICDIKQSTVEDYILFIKQNTTNNDTSVNTKLRGLRVILYYFMKLELMDKFDIKLIKAEKKIKETYTDGELKILLKKPNLKKVGFAEYRSWVIINYLLATGNRANTVCNVKVKDIDFDSGFIVLEKTKNRRQQIIPLSKTLAKVLSEYLEYRKPESEDDYLFISVYGQKLNSNSLNHSIRIYNQKRGVMKTSVHLFRHTFAKKWIMRGGDIFRLQKVLGHSSLDVVKEYVNIFGSDLQKDYDKLNALEQVTGGNLGKQIKLKK